MTIKEQQKDLQRTSKKTFNLNPIQPTHKIYSVRNSIKTLKAKTKNLYKTRKKPENDLSKIQKKLSKDMSRIRKRTSKGLARRPSI